MATQIRLKASQAADIAAVCSIGAATLREVASAIQSADLTIRQERLKDLVASVVAEPATSQLCRVIFGLSAVESRSAKTVASTIKGLSLTLASEYPDDKRFASWNDVSEALLLILQCESVYLAAKAIDVAYDFERLLYDYRIITSIRPIYTDDRDRIVGNTIVQTLRLEYVTTGGVKTSTSIALDLSDIEGLEKACADAKLKAKVARIELESGQKREIIMTGEGMEG